MSDRQKTRYHPDNFPPPGLGGVPVDRDGTTAQVMGSRETRVIENARWLSENNDLGGKLDAILAAMQDQVAETRRLNETIETLVNTLL